MEISNLEVCYTLKTIVAEMTQKQRDSIIKKHLQQYKQKQIVCPPLGLVRVTRNSILETAHHAAKDYYSTIVALHLEKVIRSAKGKSRKCIPKPNSMQKRMNIKEIHELLVPIKGIGTAKLIIGLDKNGYYVHYCCTALQ